jgi:neutral ceramidase
MCLRARIALASSLLIPALIPAAASAALKAGVASADITPPLGKYRVLSSGKIGTSVRDPLYTKALVLEDGDTRVAIVSLDLTYAFPPEMFDPYRASLKRDAGIDFVVLNASHDHNAPESFWDTAQATSDAELREEMPWNTEAMNKIYDAIMKAHASAVPVRTDFGYGQSTIGTNRREVTPAGVRTLGRTVADKHAVEPSDHRVGILRIDREDGTTLAVIVHYACHPVVLMTPVTTEFSADYVGEMRKSASSRIPGHPEILFWQGAAGDQNMRGRITGAGEAEVVSYGRELADAVVSATAKVKTSNEDGLSFRSETLSFPSRWPQKVLEVERRPEYICGAHWFEEAYRSEYSAPVGSLLLGRKLALAFIPGEPFIDYQFELDRKSPVADTWLLGYCERGYGYLPTILAATQGGYGSNDGQTLLSVGAGDIMIAHATIQIAQETGLLNNLPVLTENCGGLGGFSKKP